MNMQRFEAPDMGSALETIRRELGPDAVIISSRKRTVRGGLRRRPRDVIEVIAGIPDEAAVASDAAASGGVSTAGVGTAGDGPTATPTESATAPSGAVAKAQAALRALSGSGTSQTTSNGAAALDISAAAHEAAARAALEAATAPEASEMTPGTAAGEAGFTALESVLRQFGGADGIGATVGAPVSVAGQEARQEGESVDGGAATVAAAAPSDRGEGFDGVDKFDDGAGAEPIAAAPVISAGIAEEKLESLRAEVSGLRDLLLDNSANRGGSELVLPEAARELIERLRIGGVSEALLSRMCEAAAELLDTQAGTTAARKTVRESLLSMLRAASTPAYEHGKTTVLHLVGPSGTGKTVAAVKLAQRLSQSEGHPVVLANADQKRPGAGLQLEAYGEALGIPTAQVYEPKDLKELATEHAGSIIVLDTAGQLPRSAAALTPYKALTNAIRRRRVFLTLDATRKESDLSLAYEAFSALKPTGLILSKTDETDRYGAALSFLSTAPSPLLFLSTSDDVLDPLEAAGPATLLGRILSSSAEEARREYAAS